VYEPFLIRKRGANKTIWEELNAFIKEIIIIIIDNQHRKENVICFALNLYFLPF
jgi:hypothetical protein